MAHQLSLSFELILLFDWFLKEGQGRLQELVKEAVDKDIINKLDKVVDLDASPEALHRTVLDFIAFLEMMMMDELERRDVVPLNLDALWIDLQQGKGKSGELLKRFLKNWNPHSEESVN